ncbi:MAG: SsrA-binding protein SmpB [Planctomycetes bacterium]|nr:SsrA-binding protein SmpB [Planctomycetota bacterium]
MAEPKNIKIVCQNKKASFHYFIEKKFEAGIILQGSEVKSLRQGGANLGDAFVDFKKGVPVLYKAHIAPYGFATHAQHMPERPRELLLHKREIERISKELKMGGLTVIPLKIYFRGAYAKVELALAKGKKVYDKRDDIKKRISDREISRFNKAK